jgi:hypothetical protein
MRIAVVPREADAPLVVDPDTVCSRAVTLQQLKLVAWRDPQIVQANGPVQVKELPPGDTFDGLKSSNSPVFKERSRVRIPSDADQRSELMAIAIPI